MSSATPMASSVREVLLKTSAPIGRIDRTATRASSPESTTRLAVPLCWRKAAAALIRSSEARWANSATASGLGSPGPPSAEDALTSVVTNFGEPPVDQRHGRGALADRRRAPFDRSAAPVRMSTLSRLLTLSTRYWDIESPRLVPRTNSVTCDAYREKRTTACPAEFPPPTIATRQPRHETASLGPAP